MIETFNITITYSPFLCMEQQVGVNINGLNP